MSNSITKISCVIITLNAGKTLYRVLKSADFFDEVIVLDTGSSDQTVELAKSFNNVRVFESDFQGFGPTKRLAVSKAVNDWVFSLDADEVITEELRSALLSTNLSSVNLIGMVSRENYLLGKKITHAGWGDDFLLRLFNRNFTNFNEKLVHEAVKIPDDANQFQIKGVLSHLAVERLDQMLLKVSRYSALRDDEAKKAPLAMPLILMIVFWKFFQTYFFRKAFLEGWRGVVIAFSNATSAFWHHARRYERVSLEKNRKDDKGNS